MPVLTFDDVEAPKGVLTFDDVEETKPAAETLTAREGKIGYMGIPYTDAEQKPIINVPPSVAEKAIRFAMHGPPNISQLLWTLPEAKREDAIKGLSKSIAGQASALTTPEGAAIGAATALAPEVMVPALTVYGQAQLPSALDQLTKAKTAGEIAEAGGNVVGTGLMAFGPAFAGKGRAAKPKAEPPVIPREEPISSVPPEPPVIESPSETQVAKPSVVGTEEPIQPAAVEATKPEKTLGPEGENAWMAQAIGSYQLLSRQDMQVLVTQDAQYPEMIRATYLVNGEPTGHQLFRSLSDLKQATSNSVKIPQSKNPADMPLDDYVLMRTTLFGDTKEQATSNWNHFAKKQKQPTEVPNAVPIREAAPVPVEVPPGRGEEVGTQVREQSTPETPVPKETPPVTRDWDAFNESLSEELESFSDTRGTGQRDYDMQDVADRFVEYAKKDTSGKPLDKLVSDFAKADEASQGQIRKLRQSVKSVLSGEQFAAAGEKPQGKKPLSLMTEKELAEEFSNVPQVRMEQDVAENWERWIEKHNTTSELNYMVREHTIHPVSVSKHALEILNRVLEKRKKQPIAQIYREESEQPVAPKPKETQPPVAETAGEPKQPWEKTQREYEAQGMSPTPDAKFTRAKKAPLDAEIENLEVQIQELNPKYVRLGSLSEIDRNLLASGKISKLRKSLAVRQSTFGAAVLAGKNRPFEWATRDADPKVRELAKRREQAIKERDDLGRQIDALAEHEAWVKYAIRNNKTVPPEVLSEYPELAESAMAGLQRERGPEHPAGRGLPSEPKREETATSTVEPPAPKPKEAWEMTKEEWAEDTRKKLAKSNAELKAMGFSGKTEPNMDRHYWSVKHALAEGKPVPPEVLKDYPELQSKPTPKESLTAKPATPAEGVGKSPEVVAAEDAAQAAFEKLGAAEKGAYDKFKRKGMTKAQLKKLADFDALVEAEKQAKTKAKQQPTPAATAEGGMVGPGSPSVTQGPDVGQGGWQSMAGRDLYGIASRVREERAKAGQVAPVPSGVGVSPQDAVKWGQDLIAAGVDAEQSLKNFEQSGDKAISFDLTAITRAHGEALAKAASDIEVKFGTDSVAYRTAQKALSDWDSRTKVMDTQWNKIGMAMQGHTDIDTGTFTGIARAYKQATGQDFNPAQAATAKKLAKEVSTADKAATDAAAKLEPAIQAPEVSSHVIKLAERIVATLDARADASRKALAAMSMRFSAGVDPTIIGHLANIGASHIGHVGLDFVKWSDAMVREIGPKLEERLKEMGSSLKDIFERSQKLVDGEGDKHGPQAENVKATVKKTDKAKTPVTVQEQAKQFSGFQTGQKMTPDQVKTLWSRAREHIAKGTEDKAEVVYKMSSELGIPARDVLKGLAQNREAKRIADDVWQKQRHARILKESAKRWIEHANETWAQKILPTAAKFMFSAKTGLHGTVAIGTHAPLVGATHPVIVANNFGKMYKLVASPEYYQMQAYKLAQRPNYTLAQRAGLVNDMSKMEDFNDPRLALRFPKMSEWFRQKLGKVGLQGLVGMGVRGYSVLKILRQDLFDQEWNKLDTDRFRDENGNLTAEGHQLAKAIATSVNHITGVTETKLPSTANYALFAPKLLYSRLQVIGGDPLRAANSLLKGSNMTPAERWFATNQFKEKAKIFAVASSLMLANQTLNNLFGDKKKLNGVPQILGGGGWNPMASDFMKFRIAGMNVAWGSPFLTMMRMPLRIIQIGMGSGGKSRFLIYPDESMFKVVGSYLRTQESPFLAPITSLIAKADWQNRPLPQIPGYGPPPPVPKRLAAQGVKPYTWKEFAAETLLPIPFQEGVKEVFHYMGMKESDWPTYLKAFITIIGMAATGARISEDWNKEQKYVPIQP